MVWGYAYDDLRQEHEEEYSTNINYAVCYDYRKQIYSYGEIAKRHGISKGQVSYIIRKAGIAKNKGYSRKEWIKRLNDAKKARLEGSS